MMLCRRENALAKGGVDAGNPDAAALENPASLEAPPVNAAVSSKTPPYLCRMIPVCHLAQHLAKQMGPWSFLMQAKVCSTHRLDFQEAGKN